MEDGRGGGGGKGGKKRNVRVVMAWRGHYFHTQWKQMDYDGRIPPSPKKSPSSQFSDKK